MTIANIRPGPALRSGVAVLSLNLFLSLPYAGIQQLESKSTHYSIFYPAGYERDVEFTRVWLGRAEQLMRDKSGVTPDGYYMSVVLLPAPAAGIDTNQSGQNQCC